MKICSKPSPPPIRLNIVLETDDPQLLNRTLVLSLTSRGASSVGILRHDDHVSTISRFLAESARRVPGAKVPARVLHQHYTAWSGAVGAAPISEALFGRLIGRCLLGGAPITREKCGRHFYRDIALLDGFSVVC